MAAIGISEDKLFAYEGNHPFGHAIWPTPVLAEATFIEKDKDQLPLATDLYSAKLIFREDFFDPISRIRRGRLYQNAGGQPQNWTLQPHPATPIDRASDLYGRRDALLFTYQSVNAKTVAALHRPGALLALGAASGCSLWRIVAHERGALGEDLITLRARSHLGLLPELNRAFIPPDAAEKAEEVIEKLANSAHRLGPEAVVDRARDAAQWLLGVWLSVVENDESLRFKDLADLCEKIKQDRHIVSGVARAIARLHARGKPHEQVRRDLRPLSEVDSEFSLVAIALLIREIGWALE